MMLVDANAIDAAVRGVNKFIEGPVVVLANPGRIGELPIRRVDPHRVVAFLEVRRQITIWHQVEHRYFHFTASAGSAPDIFFQYHEPPPTPNALPNRLPETSIAQDKCCTRQFASCRNGSQQRGSPCSFTGERAVSGDGSCRGRW